MFVKLVSSAVLASVVTAGATWYVQREYFTETRTVEIVREVPVAVACPKRHANRTGIKLNMPQQGAWSN